MRLLEVNGISLLGATHQEAVNILRCSGNTITLVVCKGYDKSEIEPILPISDGRDQGAKGASQEFRDPAADGTKSLSQSVSSLDRDDEEAAILRQEQEMKAELVAWEQEERERALVEQREKSTPEKVSFLFSLNSTSRDTDFNVTCCGYTISYIKNYFLYIIIKNLISCETDIIYLIFILIFFRNLKLM